LYAHMGQHQEVAYLIRFRSDHNQVRKKEMEAQGQGHQP
jgi:hypothetical protein